MTIIGEHMFATGDDNGVVKSILYLYFIYIYYIFNFITFIIYKYFK